MADQETINRLEGEGQVVFRYVEVNPNGSFNDIAGVPTTANRELLRATLRERWGWQGLLVSDWGAIGELLNHGVAADRAGAALL